jgi:predicted alpha-1,2-mannosidase
MKRMIESRLLLALTIAAAALCCTSQVAATSAPSVAAQSAVSAREVDTARAALEVRAELAHAWQGYKRYAWGHDALRPLSKKPHDWYGHSLLMTPVDALDTLILAGLNQEADEAHRLIVEKLSFDQDVYVKNFEITIRLLGGLLSSYQLTGDKQLLNLATDLGNRLLPVFDSPTGMPYVEVNLHSGKTRGAESNPAETGTLLLEFGTLSKLTGNPVYYDKAKRALVETYQRRSPLGLIGDSINIETGKWIDTNSHISGGVDSYYEYLWKCWLLFGDQDCLDMWKTSITAINAHLADEVRGELWYGAADMNTGNRTGTTYGALDAFFPALLAFSGDLDRAKRLQASSFKMWNLHNIEPEVIDYQNLRVLHPGYQLRPEIVESTYYLYHYTHDAQYLRMGRTLFDDFKKYCRTDAGYAALKDVVKKQKRDSMESFVFAETFKYFYLLFAPPKALDFEHIVFNTEAHPLRRTWGDAGAASAIAPVPKSSQDPSVYLNPLIGTRNGGNTLPGAVVPFGMVQWSPENTKGDHLKTATAGGYEYDATRIRGFALTHLSGTGCRGASGDIPFMPIVGKVTTSPSVDAKDSVYASNFAHANETATAGSYRVRLDSGVNVELTATARTGSGRFTFPSGESGVMLVRVSDSEVGSSDAAVTIDAKNRRVTGSVTSGNFCGYLDKEDRRSYYTLYFIAQFDAPFSDSGTWSNARVSAGAISARGGTEYDAKGFPGAGKGSGAYVGFDTTQHPQVGVRVGISYVSLANAQANLSTENDADVAFEAIKSRAHDAWQKALAQIEIDGGSKSQLTTFYTALYHSLLHPNLFSDVNGEYWGFDQKVHSIVAPQKAQYANFSGWDVYRSQVQLVTLLQPDVGSDIAQSLLNQATQNQGEWDRWTHNSGGTHVMTGDPSAPAVASIYAFGGTRFDAEAALASLIKAATVPTAHDLSNAGCNVECVGQRPSLDQWLKLHYIAAKSNAWGGVGETLEDASADFAVADLAQRLRDTTHHREFLARAQNWQNLFNPGAMADAGYIQDRAANGSWPKFDPASDEGFAEGSAAQYLWMVPFNVRGLFTMLGGNDKTNLRLDAFFHNADGTWAITKAGGLHAELDNEPSIATPWLYDFSGRPDRTQALVRATVNTLWKDSPDGIPGNDDLGEMSSWHVWAALGMYPEIPGRAELVLASPLFAHSVIHRGSATMTIDAPYASADVYYVHGLKLDGIATNRPWLPESFVARGGRVEYELAAQPSAQWGSRADDAPPSFSSDAQ